eukprot:gene7541-17129_t
MGVLLDTNELVQYKMRMDDLGPGSGPQRDIPSNDPLQNIQRKKNPFDD